MEQKSKKQLLLEAREEQQAEVNRCRVALWDALQELKEMGGDDNIKTSLLEIISKYPEGIALSEIREAFPDAEKLDKTREGLRDEGKITEEGKRTKIKPVADKGTDSPSVQVVGAVDTVAA